MPRAAIIGTAGHIDHGKTLLIKLLTGVDTDRLKEEKKRGISIELGFASITLPSGRRCGVVDVPGHERFIRQMLAGAGGIDCILFVIAADEGVMPQTREHMEILELLGVSRGVVALTKVDMVDADWLELVTSEVISWLETTPLRGAPVVPVSSMTGQGKDELLRLLDDALDRVDDGQRGRFTRLPIDRVFTIEGFGTVVTGTLWGGALAEGMRVWVRPRGIETRIKALEVHGERVDRAGAGQRAAVCLHNVSREQVEHGDWLIAEEGLQPVDKIDVRLRVVPDAAKPVAHRLRIRFYLGASEIMGRLVILDAEEVPPGKEAFAQIQLESPAVAERGDRFVLRSFSPMRTIGGGRVLDVSGTRRRRFRREDLDALRVAEEGSLEDRVRDRVRARGGLGLPEADLTQQLGQPPAEIATVVRALLAEGVLHRVGRARLVEDVVLRQTGETLAHFILEAEKAQALRFGPMKSELKSRHEQKIHPEVAEAWIQEEITAGTLFVRGDRLRRSGPTLALTPELQVVRDRMLADLEGRGFTGPSQKEFLAGYGRQANAAEVLQLMLSEESVVRLPDDILLPGSLVEELRRRVRVFFETNAEMTVAGLKEILGVTRKQGVPLLEFLDTRHWTQRRGDLRVRGPQLDG
jgi:selenocysteine-specific elongation factor